jgi:N-acetyl-1-D-myo-inositol-2-amino-2-deoxy-alpha-D-glucopyranoside deacetylase
MTRRLLVVHAHPDDEAIGTGATIAHEIARGTQVTLITCTMGELGEVVRDDLSSHLHTENDSLGQLREREMAEACAALGLTDHRWLGGKGRWRDSDMAGRPGNDDPRCFWRADVGEAAAVMADVLREIRPHVVVTYDDFGLYGHPDHIQAHRVTHAGLDLVAAEGISPKVYWTALPRSVIDMGIAMGALSPDEDYSFACPDELVTTIVDARDGFDAKVAALRAHWSQIDLDNGEFAGLVSGIADKAFGIEFYRLVRGELGPPDPVSGKEGDLFAGLDG